MWVVGDQSYGEKIYLGRTLKGSKTAQKAKKFLLQIFFSKAMENYWGAQFGESTGLECLWKEPVAVGDNGTELHALPRS